MKPAQQLILIRGLPGSGKTTLAREMARIVCAEHVEADEFFLRDGAYKFDRSRLGEAHADCLARAKRALAAGGSCIVANTFTRRWEMAPYYMIADALGAQVVELVALGRWPNVHGVPDEAIEAMRARWED